MRHGRADGSERECDARGFIDPKFDDREEAVRLLPEKRFNRLPATKASPKAHSA
jgi:hypothetical protein